MIDKSTEIYISFGGISELSVGTIKGFKYHIEGDAEHLEVSFKTSAKSRACVQSISYERKSDAAIMLISLHADDTPYSEYSLGDARITQGDTITTITGIVTFAYAESLSCDYLDE